MINKLCRESTTKFEKEQKAMFGNLLLCPVMHTDCTNAKVNGKSAYVFVCAAPDGEAMYFAPEKKDHAGVKGTPAEDYQGQNAVPSRSPDMKEDIRSPSEGKGGIQKNCIQMILKTVFSYLL